MNRWFGTPADSATQASQRQQRAARRTIASLNLNPLSDEEDFQDANDSVSGLNISHLNLDGQVDEDVVESASADMNAAQLAAEKLKPFQDANFPDDDDAWKKEVKIKYNPNDVKYWFNAVEAAMKNYGINSQWSKKNAILPLLPDTVTEECMSILRLDETEAGDSIYKDLKEEILSLYGPKDEDAFNKVVFVT